MTRRNFIHIAAAAPAMQVAAQTSTQDTQTVGFRSISYNVLACIGYPRTAANQARLAAAQSQMETRMAQELLLYKPDLVTFAESVTRPAAERIANLLGMNFAWFPPGVESYPGYPIGFPGTIFTRHKILESENAPYDGAVRDPQLFTRHWGRALIDTGKEHIAVFTGHLHPNNPDIREREITIMTNVIAKHATTRGQSLLFQGDFNHTAEAPEYKRWVGAGLTDTFAARGTGPSPTFNSIAPKSRFDYIFAAGPIVQRILEARVLNEGAFRPNSEDSLSFALSDHLPVMATFHEI